MKPKNLVKTGFIVFLACTLIHYTLEFLLKHPNNNQLFLQDLLLKFLSKRN